jgi:hypothetical protein
MLLIQREAAGASASSSCCRPRLGAPAGSSFALPRLAWLGSSGPADRRKHRSKSGRGARANHAVHVPANDVGFNLRRLPGLRDAILAFYGVRFKPGLD